MDCISTGAIGSSKAIGFLKGRLVHNGSAPLSSPLDSPSMGNFTVIFLDLSFSACDATGVGIAGGAIFLLGPPRGALGGPPTLTLAVRLLALVKLGRDPPFRIPAELKVAARAAAGVGNISDGCDLWRLGLGGATGGICELKLVFIGVTKGKLLPWSALGSPVNKGGNDAFG